MHWYVMRDLKRPNAKLPAYKQLSDEHIEVFPCWDWRKVPGVTCYQEDKAVHVMGWLEKQNKGSFVGNVNDGGYHGT